MTPKQWREVNRIVVAALAGDPAARDELLNRECRDDLDLRREVESLLAASSSAGDFLEAPAVIIDRAAIAPADDPPPSEIGGYRILRRLGAGGMGVVYLAEQDHPRRQVALKVIRAGAIGPHSRARFAREAEALGRLKHPGIAQIYQAGHAAADGEDRAYIAMEYVEGRALTEYVEESRPDTARRLELFARICDAVQHAHQKGVIHRDLKPSNILVVEEATEWEVRADGADGGTARRSAPSLHAITSLRRHAVTSSLPASPKILDFGIARIADDDSAAVTLSSPRQLLGTILYMSPEQFSGDGLEIDTQTDVYALGVVGYEMLCGRLPYDVRRHAYPEVMHAICASTATPLGRVDPALRGDIETIFAKALEKVPRRRYASAAALAEDVRRYLNRQPIAARPPSTLYQMRMFARRNRGLVGGAIAAVMSMVLGTAFAAWKAGEADHARHRAVQAEQLAESRLADALKSREQAETQAATANAVTDFLRETLVAADPETGDAADATIRDALDQAASLIDRDLADRPRVEAEIRTTIGATYRSLGVYDQAAGHLHRALQLSEREFGRPSREVAFVLLNLGALERDLGQLDDSERTLRECLDIRESILQPPHDDIAAAETALAVTLVRMGRHDEAVRRHQRAIEMRREIFGDDDLVIAESLSSLAIALRFLNRHDQAEHLYRQALDIRRTLLRADHPHIAVTLHNLGRLLNDMGRYRESAELLREALDLIRKAFSGPHKRTATFLSSYAHALIRVGRFDQAESQLREALAMQRALFPDGHIDTARTLIELARLPDNRNTDRAAPLFEEAYRIAQRHGGPDDRFAIATHTATYDVHRGRIDDAESLLRQCLDELIERLGPEHASVALAYMKLGEIELARNRFDQAADLVRRCLDIRRRLMGEDHPHVTEALDNLSIVLRRAGRLEEARDIMAQVVPRRRAEVGPSSPPAVDALFNYGWVLSDLKEDEKAAETLLECMQRSADLSATPFAHRVVECAILLQRVAVRRPDRATLEDHIDAAMQQVSARIDPENEYIDGLRREIHAIRAAAAESEAASAPRP